MTAFRRVATIFRSPASGEARRRSMQTLGRGTRLLAGVRLSALVSACGGNMAAASPTGATIPPLLFSPIASTSVFLMSLDGQKLHEWTTRYAPGYSVYLLPNGRLLRATSLPDRPFSAMQGSNGGRVEMLDWNSDSVWRFDYATTAAQQHH